MRNRKGDTLVSVTNSTVLARGLFSGKRPATHMTGRQELGVDVIAVATRPPRSHAVGESDSWASRQRSPTKKYLPPDTEGVGR